METDRLQLRVGEFVKAVTRLNEACQQPVNSFIRDSVIQRFEFSFELGWKMLKVRLESEGLQASTPRQTIQEALQAGMLQDGNQWSEMLRMRNLTSHTYDEALAETVYAFIKRDGLPLFVALVVQAQAWPSH
jgi:nucleotidyltransferase substrate binding protein (TIGR01987 family)